MPYAQSHGARIYYERHGSGPAVLFCHGAGSNAATWWQQVPVFGARFSCLVYDHRCFGRSHADAASLRPDILVDDALAVLDAEGVPSAALVCQSLGGFTGLRLALAHAQRAWAFVACDSPLGISHAPLVRSVADYLAAAGDAPVEERALARGYVQSQVALAFLYAQINRFNPAVRDPVPELRARLAGLFAPGQLLPLSELRKLACPVLMVTGEHDPMVTPALARDLARWIPGARCEEIAGAGHSAYFEQPQAFNALVLEFLQALRP